jgi:hypothetical protein
MMQPFEKLILIGVVLSTLAIWIVQRRSMRRAVALCILFEANPTSIQPSEIVKRSEGKLTRGTIVTVLQSLENDFFIRRTSGSPEQGFYCITLIGMRTCQNRSSEGSLL